MRSQANIFSIYFLIDYLYLIGLSYFLDSFPVVPPPDFDVLMASYLDNSYIHKFEDDNNNGNELNKRKHDSDSQTQVVIDLDSDDDSNENNKENHEEPLDLP